MIFVCPNSSGNLYILRGNLMKNFYETILESELKVKTLSDKLHTFNGVSSIKKLSSEQATIITEISINLYFIMDKFPMVVLEELNTEELERVNILQAKISHMQTRIMELVKDLEIKQED